MHTETHISFKKWSLLLPLNLAAIVICCGLNNS